ncbi:hypothetical protein RIF29_18090 [Crotalaria pallida]|uniref:Uncharacterized protein n=1 Tax=Crotalaria pallida TaxID=3830 RepID=A0AAN9IKM8_CROPI
MVKSKAYLLFVFLFAFLLSSHLAHELPEISPEENLRSYNYEGGAIRDNFAHSKSSTHGVSHLLHIANDDRSQIPSTRLKDAGKSIQEDDGKVVEPKGYYSTFPRASRKTILGTKAKNYEDANEVRQHNMVRPSANDWRALHQALQAKISEINNGGRTFYVSVPRNKNGRLLLSLCALCTIFF